MGRRNKKIDGQWLSSHLEDHYFYEAKRLGFRARSVFKLKEIDEKLRLIAPHLPQVVVDLGAAPGSWSQYVLTKKHPRSILIALDRLPMKPLEGVRYIQGDFREDAVVDELSLLVGSVGKADLILSDLSPNLSGITQVDWACCSHLNDLAFAFVADYLKLSGAFVVKVFQGRGFDEFAHLMKIHFSKVHFIKPQASRDKSRELYLCGTGYRSVVSS